MHHQRWKNNKIFQIRKSPLTKRSNFLCICLLLVFIFVKNDPKVKGLNIFKHKFSYTAYADDSTFFLEDRKSIIELMNELNTFSNFSGFKINTTKCEIAGIGVLMGFKWHSVA